MILVEGRKMHRFYRQLSIMGAAGDSITGVIMSTGWQQQQERPTLTFLHDQLVCSPPYKTSISSSGPNKAFKMLLRFSPITLIFCTIAWDIFRMCTWSCLVTILLVPPIKF